MATQFWCENQSGYEIEYRITVIVDDEPPGGFLGFDLIIYINGRFNRRLDFWADRGTAEEQLWRYIEDFKY